jgi:rare lipoprotein A
MRQLILTSTFFFGLFVAVSGLSAQTLRWNTPDSDVQAKSPAATLPATSSGLRSNEVETGYVTYYADYLVGQPTASGEFYRHDLLTAAHRTLPFGTLLKVTRLDNNVSVTVRVNDRGTLCDGCVLSVSRSAAEALQMIKSGKIMVAVQEVGFSNVSPRPDATLTARGTGAPPQSYNYTPPTYATTPTTTSGWDPSYDDPNAGRVIRSQPTYNEPIPSAMPRAYGTAPQPASSAPTAQASSAAGVDYTRRPAAAIHPENTRMTTARAPSSYEVITAQRPDAYATSAPVSRAGNSGSVPAAANPVRGFGIQVGAYSNYDNAERRAGSLRQQGVNNVLIRPDAQRGLNRVVIGPFASSAVAKTELQRLEAQLGIRGLVLNLQQ